MASKFIELTRIDGDQRIPILVRIDSIACVTRVTEQIRLGTCNVEGDTRSEITLNSGACYEVVEKYEHVRKVMTAEIGYEK